MWILFLFVLAFVFMLGGLLPEGGAYRGGRRMRTAREDALYTQIQDAMNWEPGQPHRCECGEWVNDKGEHLKSISLNELMAQYREKNRCTKRQVDASQENRPSMSSEDK